MAKKSQSTINKFNPSPTQQCTHERMKAKPSCGEDLQDGFVNRRIRAQITGPFLLYPVSTLALPPFQCGRA